MADQDDERLTAPKSGPETKGTAHGTTEHEPSRADAAQPQTHPSAAPQGGTSAGVPAFDKLPKSLTREQLSHALDEARRISDEGARARALGTLAVRLSAGQLNEVAGAIADEPERAALLSALAPHLGRARLSEALDAARSIGDPTARVHALQAVAEQLAKGTQRGGTTRQVASFLIQWMRGQWSERLVQLASLVLVALLFGALVWVCWYWGISGLWHWGFDTFGWRSLLAPFGMLMLVGIPFWGLSLFPVLISFWNEYGALRQQVTSAREAQREIEQELKTQDPNILIVSYSRQMLSEYYAIAMRQAQRSFRYCLIAMWLGFTVLIAGAVDNLFPYTRVLIQYVSDPEIRKLLQAGNGGATLSPNNIVLISGAVIEFIAAAFLWVYRFSIQQQTYYYRRQLKLHNALLAHRLTKDMGQMKDEATKSIVERLLADVEDRDLAPPDSAGIGKLLKRS